jgi:hypothetical protein
VLKTYGISQNQLAIAIVNPMPYIRGVSESKDPSADAAFEIRQGLQKIEPAAADEFVMLCMYESGEDEE